MSILFSGDFHANAVGELHIITKKHLIQQYGHDRFNSIVFMIKGSANDANEREYTLLFITY